MEIMWPMPGAGYITIVVFVSTIFFLLIWMMNDMKNDVFEYIAANSTEVVCGSHTYTTVSAVVSSDVLFSVRPKLTNAPR
jgi:hypothetical protein